MASKTDTQVANLAAGFTIGFGFLTVWEAMKQTRRNRNPLRSSYIYMIWGEIAANLTIGVIGWVFLDGLIGPTPVTLFFILFLWVFEVQLLMQIIINRIALIAENRKTVFNIKWGTVAIITAIEVAVFNIWIPAHMNPPVNDTYVLINKYWDRTSKVLILIVDALLNYYFLRVVQNRLVKQHGLVKYKPLVGFNAKLMVLSIAMDLMLIGLMSLPNQVVYIQFHPVCYMVKLNIEMSMASLVVKLAQDNSHNDMHFESSTDPRSHTRSHINHDNRFQSFQLSSAGRGTHKRRESSTEGGIHCRTDVEVLVSDKRMAGLDGVLAKAGSDAESGDSKSLGDGKTEFGDEIPLHDKRLMVSERQL